VAVEPWQEPVRGGGPDRSFFGLSGLEQVRAYVQGVAPIPPIHHLTGIMPTQCGPGTATVVGPATPWLVVGRVVEPHLLVETALLLATRTVAPPATGVEVLWLSSTQLRHIEADNRMLFARSSIIHSGRQLALAEVMVEDGSGRQVWHATWQARLRPMEDVPPPPAVLERAAHPSYPTPDPYERPLDPQASEWMAGGLPNWHERLRAVVARTAIPPLSWLTGLRLTDIGDHGAEVTMPATAWLSDGTGRLMVGALAQLASVACMSPAAWTCDPGRTPITLRFDLELRARSVRADGQELRAVARLEHRDDELMVARGEVFDGRACVATASHVSLDVPVSGPRAGGAGERVLATILFTDIVGSTDQAARLGDAAWRDVLARHDAVVRRHLERFRGREVKTMGDGFLVTFDSPTRAVECACAIRAEVRAVGVEIRAGVHIGECDLVGGDVTGMTVNMASRIEAAAGPGEVWVSDAVRSLASGVALSFKDQGRHSLKGIDEEIQLYSVED